MVLRYMLASISVNFWLEGCKIAKKYETLWKTATSKNEFSHEKKFSDLYRDRTAKITSINFLQLYHLHLMLSKDNFGAFLWSLNFFSENPLKFLNFYFFVASPKQWGKSEKVNMRDQLEMWFIDPAMLKNQLLNNEPIYVLIQFVT